MDKTQAIKESKDYIETALKKLELGEKTEEDVLQCIAEIRKGAIILENSILDD